MSYVNRQNPCPHFAIRIILIIVIFSEIRTHCHYLLTDPHTIHVIFSWAQIGSSAIFGREIVVPDREIFSRQKKKSSLMSKIVYLHQRRSL